MIQEYFDRLIDFIAGVRRFRWTALAVAWMLALAGWLFVAQIDSKYPATARLFVDTNRILEPLLTGIAVQPNVKERVALMSKTLLNRPNIEELIDLHALDRNLDSSDGREQLIGHLQDNIRIVDTNGARSLYAVSYSHKESDVALKVVGSISDIFINSSLEEERADNTTTQDFLDKQIAEYEVRLISAEKRLADFKRKNTGSLPGESGGFYQRMENMVGLQRSSELALSEATNRRNALRSQLRQEEAKILQNTENDPISLRIAELQKKLDELLIIYTDLHPQVGILQQSIKDLESEKQQNRFGTSASSNAALLQGSVVYQEVSTLLADAEAEVAKLQARDANFKRRLADLKGTANTLPEVEAQLTQLDRDYETVREQHATLLQKREAARLTGNVERDANDVKIKLVDPPFVPSRPTDPDKLLLNTLVLIASIGGGIGFSFLLSLLHPVFYTPSSLESLTNIPVLGSVSLNYKSFEVAQNTMKTLSYSLLALLLPLALGGLLFAQIKDIGIYEKLKFTDTEETVVVVPTLK